MATLNQGATSLAAANWSDSTGFADDAVLLITEEGSQSIAGGLDRTGDTTDGTGGIHSLRIGGQFRGTIGGNGSNLQVEFETSAGITGPNYHQSSGTVYLDVSTNTCDDMVVDGGTLYLNGSGTIAQLVVQPGARVIKGENVTITKWINAGGDLDISGTNAPTSCEQIAGSTYTRTIPEGCAMDGGTLTIDTGSVNTSVLTQGGGNIIAKSGNIATYTGRAGTVDGRNLKQPVEYGTTAATAYPALSVLGQNSTDFTFTPEYIGTPMPTQAQFPGGGFSGT